MLGEYEFGIASLLNKKEGDMVNFQDSQIENFALDVKSNKQKLRSHVEVVKGQFGFLSYEQDEGKKLSFHVSEVEGGEFSAGDRDLKGFVQKMAVTAGASTAIVEAKRQEDVAAKPGFSRASFRGRW